MLSIHRQEREAPVYLLSVAKGGSKLRPSAEVNCEENDKLSISHPCGVLHTVRSGHMVGFKVPVSSIADDLTFLLGRVVLDKSGIPGEVDVDLNWTPDLGVPLDVSVDRAQSGQPDGPSLPAALQQQLGLKLDASRARIPILVIDRAQKPTQN